MRRLFLVFAGRTCNLIGNALPGLNLFHLQLVSYKTIKFEWAAQYDIKGQDQPTHPHSLTRAFNVCQQNLWILKNVWTESKGTHDTLRMRRMIWIYAFCACLMACFFLLGTPQMIMYLYNSSLILDFFFFFFFFFSISLHLNLLSNK